MNYRLTARLLGLLTLLLATSMLICLPWAWVDEQPDVLWALGKSILLAAGVGLALLLLGQGTRRQNIGRREGLLVVTGAWVLAGLVGSLPFLLAGVIPRPVDALFESVSGFTTTGASVLVAMEGVPRALLFWRSLIQWLGGMGIVMLFVAVLPSLGIGGRFLYRQEVPGPAKAGLRPHVRDTATTLWMVYMGLTVAEILALSLAGMNFFDAICHTFSTMATGGFSTHTASMGAFSVHAQAVVILFMLAAGVNFTLYANLWRGGRIWSGMRGVRNFLRDPELRLYVGLLAVATVLLAGSLMGHGGHSPAEALRLASFQAVSVQTGTGFTTADFNTWSPFSRLLLVMLMFVGGCAGSTCGSIKVIRFLIAAKLAVVQVQRFFRPRRVSRVRVGSEVVSADMLGTISGFFILFLSSWAIIALAVAATGADLVTAASASIACLGNVGPGL
ncbi:MAG: TrkH family potassium uptake protein, partial [Acidobacteria bacterium]|nr:TrkH family potassium uptake protein [Acidobacteriota bacterium]